MKIHHLYHLYHLHPVYHLHHPAQLYTQAAVGLLRPVQRAITLAWRLFVLSISLWACGPDSPAEVLPCASDNLDNVLTVKSGRLALSVAPNSESPLMRMLETNEWLCRAEIPARPSEAADKYCGLWLAVMTTDSLSGWIRVDSLAVGPAEPQVSLARWYQELQLEALLQEAYQRHLPAYRSLWQKPSPSEQEVIQAYLLADSLQLIVRRISAELPLCQAASCAQIGSRWPGFWFDREPNSCLPSFDYRQWLELAQRSPSRQDDAFISLWLHIYPADSLARGFPAWVFPTNPQEAYSLLGKGIHFQLLQKIERVWQQSPLLHGPLESLKQALLDDITAAQTRYWEDHSSILVEMDSLNQHKWVILSPADRVALSVRTQQLANFAQHGILLNYRAGWHEVE